MAITGNTELGATKQELIAAVVQKELAFSAKLMPYISDVSKFAVKGSKSISFPKLTSFAVQKRVEGVAGTQTVLAASNDKLDLDENAYVAWIIDATTKLQSNIQSESEFASRAAKSLGRQVDLDIVVELNAVAGLSVLGGAPANITKGDILAMRKYILANNGELADTALLISVDMEAVMLDIADFVKADFYGASNIPDGVIGKVYGIPVVVTNAFTGQQAYMVEKAGCAIGFQKAPSMGSQPANEYGVGATLDAMDQLYGIQGLELEQAGAAAGKSPLVAKLAD